MAYPEEVLKKARDEFNREKEKKAIENQVEREKIYKSIPKIRDLEREISTTSLRLSAAILSKKDVAEKISQIKEFNASKKDEISNLLIRNNLRRDALEPKYNCNKCQDTGIYKGKACECLEKYRRKYMYQRLGDINEKSYPTFEELNMSLYGPYRSFTETKIKKCEDYANNFTLASKSLLLMGQTGLGKTHVSKAIGKLVIDKGYDVFYVSYSTLTQKLEYEKYNNGGENYNDFLQPVLNCELLILDDVGAEQSTNFASALIYEIANSRLLKGLPTIMNTNCDEKELIQRYSERTASRLFYCYTVMLFKGDDDIRKKIKFNLD